MFEFKRYKLYGAVVLLLIVSYVAFLNRLDTEPMHLWDESSYALNALEMLQTKNPIELYQFGKPDLYNTKPPLAIWCMAVSIRCLGFNELGARVPAALFGISSVLLLFTIGYRIFRNELQALCAPLVLASSTGFIGEHICRTGDTDAILAFWILAQAVCFFLYCDAEDAKRQKIFLGATALMVTLGCLTKGIAGLTALPGLLAWLLYRRKGLQMLKSPVFYAGIGLFVLLVPGYYILRSMLTPGYLDAVWNFEVGGRMWQQEFLNPEYRPFYYFYKSMLVDERLVTWIYILPVTIGIIFTAPQSRMKDLGMFFVFALLGVSFSLGLSSTKLFWYDAPMYPLIAGVIGFGFAMLISRLATAGFALFVAVFCWPYTVVVNNNLKVSGYSHFPAFLKNIRYAGHQQDSIYIVNAEPNFSLQFYSTQDEMSGYYSKLVHPDDTSLKAGSMLVVEKYAREADINRKFIVDTLYTFHECSYYKIVGYK